MFVYNGSKVVAEKITFVDFEVEKGERIFRMLKQGDRVNEACNTCKDGVSMVKLVSN